MTGKAVKEGEARPVLYPVSETWMPHQRHVEQVEQALEASCEHVAELQAQLVEMDAAVAALEQANRDLRDEINQRDLAFSTVEDALNEVRHTPWQFGIPAGSLLGHMLGPLVVPPVQRQIRQRHLRVVSHRARHTA
jgi:phosphoglycolate phosphatase-like HAD superfamily hydrolase